MFSIPRLTWFQWPRVAMVLVAIFAVVIATEAVVTQVRKRVLQDRLV